MLGLNCVKMKWIRNTGIPRIMYPIQSLKNRIKNAFFECFFTFCTGYIISGVAPQGRNRANAYPIFLNFKNTLALLVLLSLKKQTNFFSFFYFKKSHITKLIYKLNINFAYYKINIKELLFRLYFGTKPPKHRLPLPDCKI